jgi:hypothetical protein
MEFMIEENKSTMEFMIENKQVVVMKIIMEFMIEENKSTVELYLEQRTQHDEVTKNASDHPRFPHAEEPNLKIQMMVQKKIYNNTMHMRGGMQTNLICWTGRFLCGK